MKICTTLILIIIEIIITINTTFSQTDEEEPINYYQMEPLDDSLFIKIQEELFIDPPDPKAEIIVDLRDAENQTVSVKGTLYPLLALNPETRAKIVTYPFKLNLEEQINYGSVFTKEISKLNLNKVFNPPTPLQISSTMGYVNPYLQLMGGERFGFSLRKDIGFSLGIGTPYSGVLETNFMEVNFHILGLHIGLIHTEDAMTDLETSTSYNKLYFTGGFQAGYVIPFGNFLEVSYLNNSKPYAEKKIDKYRSNNKDKTSIVYNSDGSIKYQPYLVDGSFVNWELRYPVRVFGSTRGKFYLAEFVKELHIGYLGHELTVAGSVFDFRLDAMVSSPVRPPQLVCDVIVQRVFDYWSFSSIAIGPGIILSSTNASSIGLTSFFLNFRAKIGSSL